MRSVREGLKQSGVKGKARQRLLSEARQKAQKKAKSGSGQAPVWKGKMMYWLKKEVTHRADPRAMPPEAVVEARLIARAQSWLSNMLARQAR